MILRYPLRAFFDCSTAHLSPASRTYLDGQVAASMRHPENWVAKTPYGWFVWAEEAPDETVPPDLAAVMAHARRLGAEYILFDADAAPHAELATFAWPD